MHAQGGTVFNCTALCFSVGRCSSFSSLQHSNPLELHCKIRGFLLGSLYLTKNKTKQKNLALNDLAVSHPRVEKDKHCSAVISLPAVLPVTFLEEFYATIKHTSPLGKELIGKIMVTGKTGGTEVLLCVRAACVRPCGQQQPRVAAQHSPESSTPRLSPLSRRHKLLCQAGFISGRVIKTPVNHV